MRRDSETPKRPTKTKAIAKMAIILLQEKGWIQHALRDSMGALCLIGALDEATKAIGNAITGDAIESRYDDAYDGIHDQLHHLLPVGGLAAWNDTPGRTKGEVIHLLQRIK